MPAAVAGGRAAAAQRMSWWRSQCAPPPSSPSHSTPSATLPASIRSASPRCGSRARATRPSPLSWRPSTTTRSRSQRRSWQVRRCGGATRCPGDALPRAAPALRRCLCALLAQSWTDALGACRHGLSRRPGGQSVGLCPAQSRRPGPRTPGPPGAEREQLLQQGFSNWMRRDFNAFVRACEKYGRHNLADIARDIESKTEEEVGVWGQPSLHNGCPRHAPSVRPARLLRPPAACACVLAGELSCSWRSSSEPSPACCPGPAGARVCQGVLGAVH